MFEQQSHELTEVVMREIAGGYGSINKEEVNKVPAITPVPADMHAD